MTLCSKGKQKKTKNHTENVSFIMPRVQGESQCSGVNNCKIIKLVDVKSNVVHYIIPQTNSPTWCRFSYKAN